MKLTLRVWRQRNADADGAMSTYQVDGISADMSVLEMLDTLNEELILKGEDPVAFDHDCREGICGACSLMINGDAHGPERTTTCTSSPPSRRELRQQSIAVLPPPSTTTRLPMRVVWPNETDDSQSMPMWMLAAASRRPGMSRSRPRGAPLPMNTASHRSSALGWTRAASESTRALPRNSMPPSRM